MNAISNSQPKALKAEDCHCGDVVLFRNVEYLVLLSFTDERHVQTVLTCLEAESFRKQLAKVTALRLVRTFRLEVLRHLDVALEVLENTEAEVDGLPYPKQIG